MNKLRMLKAVSIAALSALSLTSCKVLGLNKTTNDDNEGESDVVTNKHTISFYLNDTLYTTLSVSDGSSLKTSDLPSVPTVEGYTVTWDTSNVSLSNITEDLSISAKLVANEYTVTYYLIDASGNKSKYATETYTYGESITAPTVEVEDGYVFSGWSNLPTSMTAGDLLVTGSIVEISDGYNISSYASGTTITISNSGTYSITGENTNVSFNVTASDVVLVLNDVNDTNIEGSFIDATGSLTLSLSGENVLTNTASSTSTGVISSTSELTILGDGSLNVVNNNASGAAIYTYKAALNVSGGNLTLSSTGIGLQAKGNGGNVNISGCSITSTTAGASIKAKGSINVGSGTLNLTATAADTMNADTVVINGGNIVLVSKQDGIQGDTSVTVNGGTLNITTNGGHNGNAALTTSSDFTFEVEDTSSFTTADEYYGLYVYVSSKYVKVDEDNYSTYKNYTTFYNRVGCKGIKSDSLITIAGGNITIDSLDDSINSGAEVDITGGTTVITSQGDGIVGDTMVKISDGSLNISTTGTFYSVSGGSYKKSGSTYVRTDSGSYDLYNSTKGIKSDTDIVISGGTIITDTDDDAIHSSQYVTISGGTYTLTTLDDGVHADTTLDIGSSGDSNSLIDLTVVSSYEGLESGTVNIYSGTISVYALDDGINAGGGSSTSGESFNPGGGHSTFGPGSTTTTSTSSSYSINIYGGVIVAKVTSGDTDTIDSNGSYTQSGGVVVSINNSGSGGTASTLDCDGSATITGGIFLSLGSIETTPSVSGVKKTSVSSTLSSGTYTLYNSSNQALASFAISTSYSSYTMIASSGTYTISNSSTTKTITIN